MGEPNCIAGIPAAARVVLVVVAAAVGLMLTLTIVVAQAPNFDSSRKIGPLFADVNDVITYTIVAVNTGDPVADVVLSDTLPGGVVYIPGSCTYVTQMASPQTCGPLGQMWQEDFDTGGRITTTFAVQVTAGTMLWPLVNCAYLSWDSGQKEMCFTTVANPPHRYLPFVARNFTPMPDLRVTSLTVEPSNPAAGQAVTITVVVQNVGEVAAGPFWVDFYDNPDAPPTAANQPWNFLCSGPLTDCYGIAWYIDGGLAPGASAVLTSLGGYEAEQTHWLGHFVHSGHHDLYAFADSWNWGVWYGAVRERNEGVDNRYGPVSTNIASGAARGAVDPDVSIPWRPNHP